jgi:hypothetical protein
VHPDQQAQGLAARMLNEMRVEPNVWLRHSV